MISLAKISLRPENQPHTSQEQKQISYRLNTINNIPIVASATLYFLFLWLVKYCLMREVPSHTPIEETSWICDFTFVTVPCHPLH